MKQAEIPIYTDPDDFDGLIKYPCSTNFMLYDTLLHRYYLTAEALFAFGVDPESGYSSLAPNKMQRFIEEVSEDIYGVIMRLAPFNHKYNCYLIAQSQCAQLPDRYTCRKQFEKALLYQAEYKIRNIDVRDINGIDLENNQNIYHKTLRKELRHISPKSLDILHGLGVLFNGNIFNKHLINYAEGM